ncbi:MAG TPA: response regulator transcription factor [Dehalococcoidia bacterium]|nr:response regulator transcription factor [Dehalococcoidia bacterium]
MGGQRIRVLIVDDHQMVREGLKAMMETESDIVVVGEAADGAEALAKVQELVPDLVLMDTSMPGMDGLESTRRLRDLSPSTPVLMVSAHDNDAYVIQALRAGAAGYISKDSSRELLVEAVRAVSSGLVLTTPPFLRRTMERMMGPKGNGHFNGGPFVAESLTPREREVLTLMVEGLTNRKIGAHLDLAEDTVKRHVQALIAKFQASDRTEAAVKAVRAGIVSNENAPRFATDGGVLPFPSKLQPAGCVASS